jgi:hypothetical protein
VECYLIDGISSGVVVLYGFLTANIPNFDDFISCTTGDAGAVWVEFDGSHTLTMVVEGVY